MSDWLLIKNVFLHLRMNTTTGSLQSWWEIVCTSLTHNGLPTVWGPCVGWASSQGHICCNPTTVYEQVQATEGSAMGTGGPQQRLCCVCCARVEKRHWGTGTSWVSVPYSSDRRDICATLQPQTAPALRHLGCLQGCCCIWDVLLNFLKPGLLNGDVDAVIKTRIK